MDIYKLLCPKKVAIIGASEKLGMGQGCCNNILNYQTNTDDVYFVHPKYDQIFDRKCYHNVSEIPCDIDMAVICTGRKSVLGLLQDAYKKGARAAVVYASGFSESTDPEGVALEEELVDFAREYDIAVMGPNCGGYVNYIDSKFAFAFEGNYAEKKGNVGIISQSGQFCIDIMNSADIKVSYAISCGNSKIVEVEDYLDFLIDSEETKVVAMYLEGVKNVSKFASALAKAAIRRKPIVILKAGKSPQGAANAKSHTGSLAGDDAVYDALFSKFGVIRVNDLQDLISTAALFSTLRNIPERANFGAMCMSGGETGICADCGFEAGIRFMPLHEETERKLREILPFYSTPRNPLDLTVTLAYDSEVFANGVNTFLDDPSIDIGVMGFTVTDKKPTEDEYIIFEGIKLVAQRQDKPLIVVPFVESSRYPELREGFRKVGVPYLAAPQYGFLALKHLASFIEYDASNVNLSIAFSDITTDIKTVNSEYDSRKMLHDAGIDIYMGYRVDSAEKAKEIADKIGYPVVMKIDSAEIMHKSDFGCVKINVSESQVEKTYNEIISNAGEAKINGVLIQRQFTEAQELIIGVKRDPQLGLVMLVGLGGIFVELFKDVALRPLPISRKEASEMIESLKSYKLLTSYRGGINYDIEAIVNLMMHISDFACNKCEGLQEMDLNPVFVFEEGQGVQIGDALIIN